MSWLELRRNCGEIISIHFRIRSGLDVARLGLKVLAFWEDDFASCLRTAGGSCWGRFCFSPGRGGSSAVFYVVVIFLRVLFVGVCILWVAPVLFVCLFLVSL